MNTKSAYHQWILDNYPPKPYEYREITELFIFDYPVTIDIYSELYTEYVYGCEMEDAPNPDLLQFIQELLKDFPKEYFDSYDLEDDVGGIMVVIEKSRELPRLDFNIVIDRALNAGFYVVDTVNKRVYNPTQLNQ